MTFSLPLRPLAASAALAAMLGLSACDAGSGNTGGGGATLPPDIQTRAEIGCAGVAGPLDGLQSSLGNALTSGLGDQPAVAATSAQITALINDLLDLVDAIADGAGSLQALGSDDGDPALITPVLNQLLCVTAAVGEVLTSVTLAATTPVIERIALNGQLNIILDLQAQISTALSQIAEGGAVGPVAGILQQVTNLLAGVLTNPLGFTNLPSDGLLAGVLAPAADLLMDISWSFALLQGGDEQGFAEALLGSVTNLVEGLVANLGPLGVVLNPVLNLLSPVVNLLSQLLGGLLDILL